VIAHVMARNLGSAPLQLLGFSVLLAGIVVAARAERH
jgi:hypothetical protein